MSAHESSPAGGKAGVLERFSLLAEMAGGDPGFLVELMELFLEQTPELMAELRDAVTRADWHAIHTISHTLKPTFRYLEMDRAFRIADELEHCRESDPDCRSGVNRMMNRLVQEVERGLEEVAQAIRLLKRV